MLLRAYAKYMRQGNSPFAIDSIEGALADNVDLARMLVTLFETRFDPDLDEEARDQRQEDLEATDHAPRSTTSSASTTTGSCAPTSPTSAPPCAPTTSRRARGQAPEVLPLAEDGAVGDPRPARAAAEVRDLRLLAAGRGRAPALRRGRPRRPALVGPPRRLPHRDPRPGQGADGEEHRDRAGRRQGRLLRQAAARPGWRRPRRVAGRGRRVLQDLHPRPARRHRQPGGGETVPPERVVRHDGDDSYLVVAADKGTATFSDIANGVSEDYGFWLGDAFASGGSVGYDHKAMGITARGAWVSVRRHFREMGIDCQTEDITVVGVGDMSGDVFGNGMLCSEHIRLVAAFDHRDIFIDPEPDAATSYAERRRLFELPRSSWQDYDQSLISEGGGVFPRSAKSIPINHQIRVGARDPAQRRRDDAGRADEGDPARTGRPALERRHRHLRQGVHRDQRRRRRQGQRRDPGQRHRAAGARASARAATSGSPSAAGSSTPTTAAGSTPTSSTTRRASTPPTTRST